MEIFAVGLMVIIFIGCLLYFSNTDFNDKE